VTLDQLGSIDLSRCFGPSFEVELPTEIFRTVPTGTPTRSSRGTRDFNQALVELEPELPPIGHTLGKYTLERAIGIGGFAVVYQARHVLLETPFALKLLRPSVLRRRPELARSLGDEARLAAKIHHANVVRVVDVTIGGPHSYIVMDYVHGLDLAAMLRHKGVLPPRMVLKILTHVAAALRAGLGQDLVHRDIKPSNILLTREGITKLVDFGLARSQEWNAAPGAIVGTLGYMSPEHIEHPMAVDHRSDIFSLGMTAYRAMTGVLPVQVSGSASESLALLRSQPITPPERLNTRISTGISDLLLWMLQLDPARRPQDHDTVIDRAQAEIRSHRTA
jgi:serine/threonine protein kinase